MTLFKKLFLIAFGFAVGMGFSVGTHFIPQTVLPRGTFVRMATEDYVERHGPIGLAEGQDSLAQRVTSTERIRFADPTNVAYSLSSISLGFGNEVGHRGYEWTDIDFTNNIIVFKTQPVGWEVGDTMSIINKSKHIDCANITNIVGTSVYFTRNATFNFDTLVEDPGEEQFDYRTAYVLTKPEVGNKDIGQGAFASGVGNKSIGFAAHSEGWGNVAQGQYSHVEGRENTASYVAHAEGENTAALGFWSHAAGHSATSRHDRAWTWSGAGAYQSHGGGTFNINPAGGINGFYIGNRRISDVVQEGYGTAIDTQVNSRIEDKIATEGIPVFGVKTNAVGKIVEARFDSDGDENYGQFRMFLDIGGDLSIETLYGRELPENAGKIEVYSKQTLDGILSNLVTRIEAKVGSLD